MPTLEYVAHAQFYEEALSLPHVGVGIDPNGDADGRARQTSTKRGTVTAAEINQVIEWLDDLVNS